jgi:protein-tyrosine phosphatase
MTSGLPIKEITMPDYPLNWITQNLATGYAPMSHAELSSIKAQGIDAIINLCAEFSDLHLIEEKAGFEVYYLPVWDEEPPRIEEMEKGLGWLDEAIYLGKKILVHCRHGIGRTGTLVASYMIRRGMPLKSAEKKLKKFPASPTSYGQWKLLKKYGKKSSPLTIREPYLEQGHRTDLRPWFKEYEALVLKIEAGLKKAGQDKSVCGRGTPNCCYEYLTLDFVEAVFLSHMVNKTLKSGVRLKMIERAADISSKTRKIERTLGLNPAKENPDLVKAYAKLKLLCPLNDGTGCMAYEFRPIRCRCHPGLPENPAFVAQTLNTLSKNLFFAFSATFLPDSGLRFSLGDTLSGKFIQVYFHHLNKSGL